MDEKPSYEELEQQVRALKREAIEREEGFQSAMLNQELFRTILDHSNESMVIGQDGYLKAFNIKTMEVTGRTEEELRSIPFIQLVHEDDQETVMRRHLDRVEGKEPDEPFYIFRVKDKTGAFRHLETTGTTIEWKGRPASLHFMTEVTKRRRAEDALMEKEASYRELVQHAPAGIVEIDLRNGRFFSVNEIASQISGYSRSEFLEMNVLDFLDETSRSLFLKDSSRFLKGQPPPFGSEYRFRKKDGTWMWAMVNSNLVLKDGKAVSIRIVAADITQRKQAEELVQAQRDLAIALGSNNDISQAMKLLLEAALRIEGLDCGCAYLVNVDSRDLEVSAFQGVSPDFVHDVSTLDSDSGQADIVMDGKPTRLGPDRFPKSWAKNMGAEGIRGVLIFPVVFEGKVEAAIVLASRDQNGVSLAAMSGVDALAAQMGGVIARGRAEARSRASEEKYRYLVENATDAIAIVQDIKVKFANPAALSMFGYSIDELSRIDFGHLVDAEYRDVIIGNHLKRLSGGDVPNTYSFPMIKKSGEKMDVQLNAARITWEERPAILAIARDVTEAKKLEEQLEHAQRMEAIGALAGGVAHDFNNLLMAIQGNTSLMLLHAEPSTPVHKKLENIEFCVKSGAKLTKQLLGYAKGGKYEVAPRDINQIVSDSAAMFGRTKREINIHKRNLTDI